LTKGYIYGILIRRHKDATNHSGVVMYRTFFALTFLSTLVACTEDPNPPSKLGFASAASSTNLAQAGDTSVEFLTWYLPEENVMQVTFTLRVPSCDTNAGCAWIPDVYSYTQHDTRTPPVRTMVQDALEICWLVDEEGEVVHGTGSLPATNGDIVFQVVGEPSSVTLTCNISEEAKYLTIGTNLDSVQILESDRGEYGEVVTYLNTDYWIQEPSKKVLVR